MVTITSCGFVIERVLLTGFEREVEDEKEMVFLKKRNL